MTNFSNQGRRAQVFPVKLNPDLRHGICFRYALGFRTKQIQAWLLEVHGIKVGYHGIWQYTQRPRWRRLTSMVKTEMVFQDKVQKMILEMVQKWHEDEIRALDNLVLFVLNEVIDRVLTLAGAQGTKEKTREK